MPHRTATRPLNQLLAVLPADCMARLETSIDIIPLILKDYLHKPGEAIEYVYFPGAGFCSVLAVLEDGGMVEVATIGSEGVAGVTAVLDGNPPTSLTMVQAASPVCYRMPATAFRAEYERRGPFHQLMNRYSQALVSFVMQSAACNAVHTVEQRLARWLLMARDRMGSDQFPLTQEFVAMMLGAARPTVTVVAGTLQKAGLIKYHRGMVTIVNGPKLEAASCECYRAASAQLLAVTAKRLR
jgi:CRP-like cAMP-binding protein